MPIGMQYRTETMAEGDFDYFYYEKDLLGNVIGVYNESGYKLIEYSYDAWGNCKYTYKNGGGSTGAQYNAFRYRGYYYDSDMGFYYLNDRYYDSITGRFLTPDDPSYLGANGDLLSFNLYAYCSNNPVMYVDPTGHFPIVAVLIGIAIGAAIGFMGTVVADYVDDGEVFNGSISTEGYIANTLVGGLIGGLTGGLSGVSFTISLPTFGQVVTTAGTLQVVMVGTTTITVSGGVIIAGIASTVLTLMSKPDNGPIRFNDGTGIDPDTGKPVSNKERAEELFKKITDPKKKANWKQWMKGKGWRRNHLK